MLSIKSVELRVDRIHRLTRDVLRYLGEGDAISALSLVEQIKSQARAIEVAIDVIEARRYQAWLLNELQAEEE